MTQPKQLKEEINNLMKEWMKECAKECCEKCQGIRKGSTGTEYYCLITNCPCHQSPDNTVKSWEETKILLSYCFDKGKEPDDETYKRLHNYIASSRSQVVDNPMGASQWKQHGIK